MFLNVKIEFQGIKLKIKKSELSLNFSKVFKTLHKTVIKIGSIED